MKIIATGLRFPEGPIAMPDGSVLVVEIERQTLSRVSFGGAVEVVAEVPGGPNGAAIGPDGRVYICNNGGMGWVRDGGMLRPHGVPSGYEGGGIDVVDLACGRVERLYSHCGLHRLIGPNDLVFDGQGGFWFTDLGKRRERDMDRGFIFWARADGSEIRQVAGAMLTPNGIGLSPDGRTLYVAETDTGRIWGFEVTGPGELRLAPWPSPNGGRIVAGLGGYARFDSLAVTASGNICAATVEGCSIAEISPVQGLLRHHTVPDLLTTNICFGGTDLRTAYVTLSHSGRLGAMDWHEPGLALAY
ncbi:MAG: gluconolactonase [Rhodoferax sp.]|nr:gluconolactonase [Rhodoferax sp.]